MNIIDISTQNNANEAVLQVTENRLVGETAIAQNVQSDTYSKLYFPVEEVPLFGMRGDTKIPDRKRKMIIRTDTDEVLSVQSMDYKLVSNEVMFSKLDEAIANSALDTTDMKITEWSPRNGAQAVRRYEFPKHQAKIGEVEGEDDLLNLNLYVRNSYDSSSAFRVMLGAMRLLCWNGMVMGNKDVDLYGRHTKNFNINNMIRKLDVSLNMFAAQADEWRTWQQKALSEADARMLLDNSKKLSESAKEVIMLQYIIETRALGHTVWALFQALTWWSTHSKLRANGEETAGDNIINIRLQREELVRRFVQSKPFLQLAA